MRENKLGVLLKQGRRILTSADLRVLWQMEKKNTLYKSVERLVKKGILIRIWKGFFSVVPIDKLDPVELGNRLVNRRCYLSTETVLARAGLINQSPTMVTFVSDKNRKMKVGNNDYLVRQMNDKYLGNLSGISQRDDGVLIASTERAVADMLYFRPGYHFDSGNIDWDQVLTIQREVGFK